MEACLKVTELRNWASEVTVFRHAVSALNIEEVRKAISGFPAVNKATAETKCRDDFLLSYVGILNTEPSTRSSSHIAGIQTAANANPSSDITVISLSSTATSGLID